MKSTFSTPEIAPRYGAFDAKPPRYELSRALAELSTGRGNFTGYAGEWHQELVRQFGQSELGNTLRIPTSLVFTRAMTSAGVSGSQYLVGTDNLAGNFIDMLRPRSVAMRLGMKVMPGLVGNVTIPKQSSAATMYWLNSETAAITASQPAIAQLPMTPKTVGVYTEFSRTMMLQSSPAVDLLILQSFAKDMAQGIDAAVLAGTGTGGQPTGILNTAGIGTVASGALDFAKLIEFQVDAANSNALDPNSAYATTPALATALKQRQRFANTDSPLWEGQMVDGKCAGARAITSTAIPAGTMIFGSFENVILGEWGFLEIAMSNSEGNNFRAGIVAMRALQTVDVAIRHPAAFSVGTALT